VILDDVNVLPPDRQAVIGYRSRMGITAVMHEADWSASLWTKPQGSAR